MVAGNPIHVEISTDSVKGIYFLQLTFDGADTYFPACYDSSNATSGNVTCVKSVRVRPNNVVPLEKEVDSDGNVTFSGNATLTYYQGGNFDIGITFRREDSPPQDYEGYEWGQPDVKIAAAVPVSPPETLLTMKTNQLITGIS